ncbi:MAG: glycosyltransferase [Actinomycetota bacterium]|nr:glycosyltransferase [Actinomycetota bacterium]
MKVAMVSEHASPLAALGGVDSGGQNVHVAALATQLGRRGIEVVVHTRRDHPSLPREVRLGPWVSVDHVDAGPPEPVFRDDLLPYMDDFADDLARQWRRNPPDLIHAHHWMSGRAALAAAGLLGTPVLQTFHMLGVVKRRHLGPKDTSPPERIDEEREIIRAVDGIIATCSDEVFELVRLGADIDRVRVVPCGVDLELFTPEGPREPRTPGLHRLVVVTRLVERKGVGNVITALAHIPDSELIIVGGGDAAELGDDPDARRLRRLAVEAGVADRVQFRGRVKHEDVPPLLRSADVFVTAPWYEPFGITPLEAMACGVPVVATAVGGLIDTVVHGVTGLHVPPRRPDRIADAIVTLLGDRALSARIGAAGLERARSRYGWERVADATLEAYMPLVDSERVATRQVVR